MDVRAAVETGARAAWITVAGARTHNLRGVDVRVPKHRITVCTGVSGSGKSSLAFGTIAAEAHRLVSETYPPFIRSRLPHLGAADVERVDGLTFTTVVEQQAFTGNARSTVGTATGLAPLLRVLFSRTGSPSAGFSPAYSFNDPSGMCPRCEGLGTVDDIDLDVLLDRDRSLQEGAIRFPAFAPGTYRWKRLVLSGLADPEAPLRALPPDALESLLHARGLRLPNREPGYPQSGVFDGVVPRIRDGYLRSDRSTLTAAERDALDRVVTRRTCPDCGGARVNAAARASRIDGASIADWHALPIEELRPRAAAVADPGVAPVVAAILTRLDALVEIGLGYLSLGRISSTLSGGEAQRVKLVRHLGSPLSDVTYVFDEPSAGLHPHDIHRLLRLLGRLRDAHNTVLVVEHHPDVIARADHVIDLGPGAGSDGGRVQFEGPPERLRDAPTATGRVLRARPTLNDRPRSPRGRVRIDGASRHNLRDVSVDVPLDVPLGVLTVATGVAGSGKSTLFAQELPRRHPDFTVIDQRPLRGGARSTVATVLGIADPIRARFAAASGRHPSWFSANGRGACPECRGTGVIRTDLAFLDDVTVVCEACGGSRFGPVALAHTVQGRTIAEVLELTAATAHEAFAEHPAVAGPLGRLRDVGLHHLALGRSITSLSGGERQRLRLAQHLSAHGAATRLVLDEPTAGLHPLDADVLLALFDRIIDRGATVVAIEHNPRVIARADHLIDVGPGAGAHGGRVVYAGPPAGILGCAESLTGAYFASGTGGRTG